MGAGSRPRSGCKETPILFKTPSGYVQQSPWLGIANKQLELMGRFMVELGMTPAARSRVTRRPRAARRDPVPDVYEEPASSILLEKLDALRKRSRPTCSTGRDDGRAQARAESTRHLGCEALLEVNSQ